MPAAVVKEFAENSEASVEKVEELWNKYKKQLEEEQGYSGDELYGTLVKILKKKLKEDYNLTGYDSKMYICQSCLSTITDRQYFCHKCGSQLESLYDVKGNVHVYVYEENYMQFEGVVKEVLGDNGFYDKDKVNDTYKYHFKKENWEKIKDKIGVLAVDVEYPAKS